MNFKIYKSDVNALLLVLFPYFIALGAYSETNTITLGIYVLLAIALFIFNPMRIIRFYRDNISIKAWILFLFVSLFSTIIHGRFGEFKPILVDFIITIICFVLCTKIRPERYFDLLRKSILILCIFGLFTFLFHIDVFSFKNSLSMHYSSVDAESGGGISTLFEYRHYYGLYLVSALFVQILYPFKKSYMNFIAYGLLTLNIVATYTRSVWIVLCVCWLFWLCKFHSTKITNKTMRKAIYGGLILIVMGLLFSVVFFDKIAATLANISFRMDVFDTSDKYFGGVRLYVLREGFSYIFSNWKDYFIFGGGTGFAIEWLKANPFGQWGEWSSSIDVQYVTSFMDTGIVGLTILICIVKRIITSFFKAKSSYIILVSYILVYFVFIIFFYDIFGTVTSAFPLWCICIMLLKKEHIETHN